MKSIECFENDIFTLGDIKDILYSERSGQQTLIIQRAEDELIELKFDYTLYGDFTLVDNPRLLTEEEYREEYKWNADNRK